MISTPDQSRGIVGLWDRFTAPTERYRRPFRSWRRGRPFPAGLSIVLAGLEIYWVPQTSVGRLLSMGLPGISSLFIPIFLVIFAVTIWFFPAYRVFAGIATIMFALLSLVATNLGGFFIGFLLAMLGGAFAVAWTPRTDYTADTRRQRRRLAGQQAGEAEFAGADGAEETSTVTLPAQGGADQHDAQAEDTAQADDAEHSSAGAPAGEFPDDARIIHQSDQSDRSEQAVPAAPDPAPEQE